MKHGKIFMRVAVFLLSALLLFSFSSCSVSGQLHASPRAGKTVAKAGNVKILYEELYYFAMNKRAEMVAEEGEHVFDDPEKRTELENFVWGKLLTRETALRSVGEDYGLSVYDGELSDNIKNDIDALVRENYNGDRKTYVRALEGGYLTDHYLRMIVGVSDYLSASIVLNMMKRGEVDTSDEAVWKAARSSALIRTIHVFLSNDNGRTDAENRANAEALAARVAAVGSDAERLAAMRTEVGGKYNNDFGDTTGDGYYFGRGEMESAYEDAAFALPLYGVSGAVKGSGGYYVIMALPKEESYLENHLEELKDALCYVELNNRVDARLAEMKLEKTAFGSSLDLLNLPPIKANGGAFLFVLAWILLAFLILGVIFLVGFLCTRKKRKGKKTR